MLTKPVPNPCTSPVRIIGETYDPAEGGVRGGVMSLWESIRSRTLVC